MRVIRCIRGILLYTWYSAVCVVYSCIRGMCGIFLYTWYSTVYVVAYKRYTHYLLLRSALPMRHWMRARKYYYTRDICTRPYFDLICTVNEIRYYMHTCIYYCNICIYFDLICTAHVLAEPFQSNTQVAPMHSCICVFVCLYV